MNDPTNWNPKGEFDSLTFASYTDAKKAEVLFSRMQREIERLSALPEALAFQEAVWLLEVCRSCDLVYDGPWGPTGPDVHVIVDAFLKKHKSVIEGYAPQCPESPLGTKT